MRDRDAPTPVDAMVRLVRAYARKVRSEARWSRATLPEFSSVSSSPDSFMSSRHRGSRLRGFRVVFEFGPDSESAPSPSLLSPSHVLLSPSHVLLSSCSHDISGGVAGEHPPFSNGRRPRLSNLTGECSRVDGSGGDGSGDDGRSGDSDGGGRVRTVGSSRTAAIVCKVKVKEAKAERRRVSGEAGALDLVSISYIFVLVNSECGVHLWSLACDTDHGFDVMLPAGCLGRACMQDQVSRELTMERPMRGGSDSHRPREDGGGDAGEHTSKTRVMIDGAEGSNKTRAWQLAVPFFTVCCFELSRAVAERLMFSQGVTAVHGRRNVPCLQSLKLRINMFRQRAGFCDDLVQRP